MAELNDADSYYKLCSCLHVKILFFAPAGDTAVLCEVWHSLKIAELSGAEALFSHLLLTLILQITFPYTSTDFCPCF